MVRYALPQRTRAPRSPRFLSPGAASVQCILLFSATSITQDLGGLGTHYRSNRDPFTAVVLR
ncbi:hypothetical protein E2C01_074613 [Portunus trituberculatus]|uniref:Uncharacterized protein n=1 Tax=Portunus trituberculatus TaxID=210409 RepID=A0A5B7IGR3_PORTR|nr:hypothetical protein [Portunus trituberculatus]